MIFVIDAISAEIITKKYYKAVYSFCFSNLFCDEDGASEVTQEVFKFFYEKREKLEDINIQAWLYGVANNKIKEYVRANKKLQKHFEELTENSASISDAEIFVHLENDVNIDDEEILKQKEFVLKALSKRDRELYEKIYVEKKSHKEIAEELNIPLKTVGSRAFRLRKRITKRVNFTFTSIGQLIIKIMF